MMDGRLVYCERCDQHVETDEQGDPACPACKNLPEQDDFADLDRFEPLDFNDD